MKKINEENLRITSTLLENKYLQGELLSSYTTLLPKMTAIGVKAYEIDLTGTDNKFDAFYMDPAQVIPRKIITFV